MRPRRGVADHERSRPRRSAGSARAVAQQAAQQQGKAGWRFTLEGPSYIAFMTYADVRELRRQMYEGRSRRAPPRSGRLPVAGTTANWIPTILKLRTEVAALLGYPNYAEYALQTRMAKSVTEVMQFLRDLACRARPAAQQQFEELVRFAHDQHGVATLEAWDVAYYSEKLRQQRYAISQEDLRPYLPENQGCARYVRGRASALRPRYPRASWRRGVAPRCALLRNSR